MRRIAGCWLVMAVFQLSCGEGTGPSGDTRTFRMGFDVGALPPPVPDNLGPFVYLGLVDANLEPKPALQAWDSVFALPRR